MGHGFLYLVAVLDWHARYVISWQLSNTLNVGFRLTAMHEALGSAPASFVFNSDQASQFTSQLFEQDLLQANCRINRFWRSIKWECVYLNPANDSQHL